MIRNILLVAGLAPLWTACSIDLTTITITPEEMRAALAEAEAEAEVDWNLLEIEMAVDLFRDKNQGRLPESLERLVEKDEEGQTYLTSSAVLRDRWGHEYFYVVDPDGYFYKLGSYGRDGEEGGTGENGDRSQTLWTARRSI